jgi:phosphonate transport system substrate-binding protein
MNKRVAILVLSAVILASCGSGAKKEKLVIGLIPQDSVEASSTLSKPFEAILEKRLPGVDVEIFIGTNYDAVIEGLISKKVDISFLAPAAFIKAKERSGVKAILQAKVKGIWEYDAVMITPVAKPLDDIQSLKGKNVLFGSASSTSGFIVPLGHLIDKGVTLKELGSWRNMEGGHTSVILSVANGEADAGFTWLPGIDLVESKTPGTAAKLHVTKLGTVPNDPVVAREGLDAALIAKVQKAFIEAIEDTQDGPIFKQLYFYDDFRVIEDSAYDDVGRIFAAVKKAEL